MYFDKEYFLYHLFNPGAPICIVLAIFIFASASTCIALAFPQTQKYKNVVLIWLIAYLYLMLHIAIFGRESKEFYSLQLTPFWSLAHMKEGYTETFYEKLYNILFFTPYGLLLGLYFKGRRISRSLMTVAATSACIETLQLMTRTGTCETDDVVCNTLGGAIGCLIVMGMVRLRHSCSSSSEAGGLP